MQARYSPIDDAHSPSWSRGKDPLSGGRGAGVRPTNDIETSLKESRRRIGGRRKLAVGSFEISAMDDHRVKRRKHSHERSRSPGRRHRDSGREGARRSLPFDAPELKKDDLDAYRDIFAKYLHDKKDITIETLSSNEAYARFKSFIHKWNDGELSSRYYDPEYRRKLSHDNTTRKSPDASHENPRMEKTIGPTLPTQHDIQLQKGPPQPNLLNQF